MKIRYGFVSNSSSSSFIIEIKQSIPCNKCGREDENIVDFIERYSDGSGNTCIEAKGKQEVLKYVKEWVPDLISEINKAKGELVCLSISNHNEFLNKLIKKSQNINILYEND